VINPEGKNPLLRLRIVVRMMLKLIIKVLVCGCVTLILITKNVTFLLWGTKCDILIKRVNLETAPCFWSLSFFQHSSESKLTKTAPVSVLR